MYSRKVPESQKEDDLPFDPRGTVHSRVQDRSAVLGGTDDFCYPSHFLEEHFSARCPGAIQDCQEARQREPELASLSDPEWHEWKALEVSASPLVIKE